MTRVREESVEARALATAAEQLLAELGVTEPGAGRDNHELPAGALMDALYAAWNQYMRAKHGQPEAIFEPEGAPEVDARCLQCDSALAAAALARPMVLEGIHCGHCGRLNRARGVGA